VGLVVRVNKNVKPSCDGISITLHTLPPISTCPGSTNLERVSAKLRSKGSRPCTVHPNDVMEKWEKTLITKIDV
jgi:hypothetical protein